MEVVTIVLGWIYDVRCMIEELDTWMRVVVLKACGRATVREKGCRREVAFSEGFAQILASCVVSKVKQAPATVGIR